MDSGRESALSTFTSGSVSPTKHLGLSSAKSLSSSNDFCDSKPKDEEENERRSDLILVSLVLLQQELERQLERLSHKDVEIKESRPFLVDIDENCCKMEATLRSCGSFISELIRALGEASETLLKISDFFLDKLRKELGDVSLPLQDGTLNNNNNDNNNKNNEKSLRLASEIHASVAATTERLTFVSKVSAEVRRAALEAAEKLDQTKDSAATVKVDLEKTSAVDVNDNEDVPGQTTTTTTETPAESPPQDETATPAPPDAPSPEDPPAQPTPPSTDATEATPARLETPAPSGGGGGDDDDDEKDDGDGDDNNNKEGGGGGGGEGEGGGGETRKREDSAKGGRGGGGGEEEEEEEEDEEENLEQIIFSTETTVDDLAQQMWIPLNFPLDFPPDDVLAGQSVTLKVPPGTLTEADLRCEALEVTRYPVPIQEGDELLTYLVKLSTKNRKEVRFKPEPCQLILPHVPLAKVSGKEPIVKMCRLHRGKLTGNWRELRSSIIQPEKQTNLVETSLSSLTTVVLAVISRFRRDRQVVRHEGSVLQSTTDPRVKFQIHKGCVRISNNIAIQTRPTDSEDLMDILRTRDVEMDFLSIMSPILDFASVGRIIQPVAIQVPCKAPSRPAAPGAETKKPGGAASVAGEATPANSDDESSTPAPKQRNNQGNGLDLPDKFVLLARDVTEDSWEVRDAAEFPPSKRSDLVKVNYRPERLHEKLIVMRLKPTAKSGQPEELARQMELALNERRVGVFLFQRMDDPTRVLAELATKSESEKIEERLTKQGFAKTAVLTNDLPIIKEGQRIEIKFRNNIKQAPPIESLVIPFHANLRSRSFFKIAEVEKFQDNYKSRYQGFVQFWMNRPKKKISSAEDLNQGDAWMEVGGGIRKKSGGKSPSRASSNQSLGSASSNQSLDDVMEFVCFAELLISLPKPEPVYNSNVDRAPMKLTSVDQLFMDDIVPFIKKNFKTYWDILARTLGLSEGKISEIYAQWIASGGDDQEAIQLVVLNWLKRTSKSQNRIQLLSRHLSDLEQWHIVDYIKKKEKEIKQEKANMARQEKLDRATQCVSKSYTLQQRWKELARHLNLTKQTILKLSSIPDSTDRCHGVMIHWRESNGGPNARLEEVVRALRRMGVNPVADKLARGNF